MLSGVDLEVKRQVHLPNDDELTMMITHHGKTDDGQPHSLQHLVDLGVPLGQSRDEVAQNGHFACVAWKSRGDYYVGRLKQKEVSWASSGVGAAQGIVMFIREAVSALSATEAEVRAAVVGSKFDEASELGRRLKFFFDEHWKPDVHEARDACMADRTLAELLDDATLGSGVGLIAPSPNE